MDSELAEALTIPAKFDGVVYRNPAQVASQLRPHARKSRLLMNRYALAAFLAGDTEEVRRLSELPEGEVRPGAGYRFLLPTLLGRFSENLRTEVYPSSLDPLDIEEACYGAMALGVSCVEAHQFVEANGHLQAAHSMAVMLKMRNRVQTIEIERQRAAMLCGKPNVRRLQELMGEAMPERRRNWNIRTLAELHMAEGRYEEALRVIGTPHPDEDNASLRAFLHALMGLPPVPSNPTQVYSRLAQALHGGGNLDNLRPDFGAILGEPEAGYAALVEAVIMSYRSATRQQAVRLVGQRNFLTPNQRMFRAFLLLALAAIGAQILPDDIHDPHLPFGERLLQVIPEHAMVNSLGALRYFAPDIYVLLSMSHVGPKIHLPGITEIPLIAGQFVLFRGAEHPLPGRTGKTLVLEGMGLPYKDLSREEQRRLRAALSDIPEPRVNLGAVATYCLNLSQISQQLGHHAEAAAWQSGYSKAIGMMSSETQSEIRDATLT